MAEVLGTAVGVISLGIQVAGGLIKYYTSYKDRVGHGPHCETTNSSPYRP